MSFRGAGGRIMLPVDRARQAISPFMLSKEFPGCAHRYLFINQTDMTWSHMRTVSPLYCVCQPVLFTPFMQVVTQEENLV